jgi:hypothetical protein
VKSIVIELYRKDYIRRRNCDTLDGSTCVIINCVNVRASGINSLYAIRREVTCRALYTQHVTIWCQKWDWTYTRDNLVSDLINALPGNSYVNTVRHATIGEAVSSVSFTPSSGGTTELCNPFLSNDSVNTLLRNR